MCFCKICVRYAHTFCKPKSRGTPEDNKVAQFSFSNLRASGDEDQRSMSKGLRDSDVRHGPLRSRPPFLPAHNFTRAATVTIEPRLPAPIPSSTACFVPPPKRIFGRLDNF